MDKFTGLFDDRLKIFTHYTLFIVNCFHRNIFEICIGDAIKVRIKYIVSEEKLEEDINSVDNLLSLTASSHCVRFSNIHFDSLSVEEDFQVPRCKQNNYCYYVHH